MPLASGIELPERYRVTRHIASGGMASVWEVEDLLLGRVVAVKVLGAQYAADQGARARFQREARTAARVSEHPHIATIFDTGEHGEDAYIVMEYFSGGTVADRLRAAKDGGEPVPRETALRWLREAAMALDAAHEAGIVHRDVKPANLLLDANERLAVGDFGIARLADDTQMTQTGQVLGTAAYLSPEQATGRPVTAASDRYALAVVAYELLTGQRPFPGGPATAQARQHVEDQPEKATQAAPDLPDSIDPVFGRGLAKDAADRPATAAALVEEIEKALGAGTAPTKRVEPTRAMPPIVPAAGAAGAAGAAAAGTPRRDSRDAPPVVADPGARPRRSSASWLPIGVAAATVAAVVVAIALASAGGDGGSEGERARTTTAERAQSAAADSESQDDNASENPASPPPPPPPPPPAADTSSASPTALNDQGYQLQQAGDHAEAVPLLRQAVEGFRAAGDTSNVSYHYALYNLGTALMATGDPAAAIPYLEERLRLSNDRRGLVRQTLEQARAQANGGEAAGDGEKKPKDDKGDDD